MSALPSTFPQEKLLPEKVLFLITVLMFPHHVTNKIEILEGGPLVYHLKIMLKTVKCIVTQLSKNQSSTGCTFIRCQSNTLNSHKEACLTKP